MAVMANGIYIHTGKRCGYVTNITSRTSDVTPGQPLFLVADQTVADFQIMTKADGYLLVHNNEFVTWDPTPNPDLITYLETSTDPHQLDLDAPADYFNHLSLGFEQTLKTTATGEEFQHELFMNRSLGLPPLTTLYDDHARAERIKDNKNDAARRLAFMKAEPFRCEFCTSLV